MSVRLHAVSDDARPAVEARALRKTYPGGVEAVRGIDFQVAPGEVFGLLGPNGAGKSTTIGMLTTTIKPTSGSARLAGFDVVRNPLAARSVSSVVFQEPVLDKALTGRRNLDLHARLWGISPAAAASKIAGLAGVFGLSEVIGRPVDSYSGGQRRRLEIARALVSEPRVLFLDEPTAGLDTRIRYELLDLISGLRGRTGMTTVLTTHYLDEAERLCDRIAVMHQGAIVAMDRPAALLAELGAELVELRVEHDPAGALAAMRAQLLAAPIPRSLIVLGNMAVAIAVSLLQVAALIVAGWARGSHFHVTPAGAGWFLGAVLSFTVFMYAVSEILANRIPTQEEYVGLTPVVAILPWFLAGSLFPITALPGWLAAVARILPTTHTLALLRYGVLGHGGTGLHDIWGIGSNTADAALSLLVLAGWAALATAASIRVFKRSAVH